jgi:hypothetical protein
MDDLHTAVLRAPALALVRLARRQRHQPFADRPRGDEPSVHLRNLDDLDLMARLDDENLSVDLLPVLRTRVLSYPGAFRARERHASPGSPLGRTPEKSNYLGPA